VGAAVRIYLTLRPPLEVVRKASNDPPRTGIGLNANLLRGLRAHFFETDRFRSATVTVRSWPHCRRSSLCR
jgi:hypothetical protein